MRLISTALLAIWLSGFSHTASALSAAPLQVINAYIEGSGQCDANLIEWNRKYNARTIAGEISRVFYYRAVGLQEWGNCGRPYFKNVFSELHKVWLIFANHQVSEAEITAKEAELIDLLFAALAAGEQGSQLVQQYEQRTTWRLQQLEPARQFFNCTFFAEQVQCTD